MLMLIILSFLAGYLWVWCSDITMEIKSLKAQQNTIQIQTANKYVKENGLRVIGVQNLKK